MPKHQKKTTHRRRKVSARKRTPAPRPRVTRTRRPQSKTIDHKLARYKSSGAVKRNAPDDEFVAAITHAHTVSSPLIYMIYPTNANLFPTMATQALQYEKYKIKSLKLQYVADANATLSGTVFYGVNTDPRDVLTSVTIGQCMSWPKPLRRLGRVCNDFVLNIPVAQLQRNGSHDGSFFMPTTTLTPTSTDVFNYACGQIKIFTNVAASNTAGYFVVHADFEFINKKANAATLGALTNTFWYSSVENFVQPDSEFFRHNSPLNDYVSSAVTTTNHHAARDLLTAGVSAALSQHALGSVITYSPVAAVAGHFGHQLASSLGIPFLVSISEGMTLLNGYTSVPGAGAADYNSRYCVPSATGFTGLVDDPDYLPGWGSSASASTTFTNWPAGGGEKGQVRCYPRGTAIIPSTTSSSLMEFDVDVNLSNLPINFNYNGTPCTWTLDLTVCITSDPVAIESHIEKLFRKTGDVSGFRGYMKSGLTPLQRTNAYGCVRHSDWWDAEVKTPPPMRLTPSEANRVKFHREASTNHSASSSSSSSSSDHSPPSELEDHSGNNDDDVEWYDEDPRIDALTLQFEKMERNFQRLMKKLDA
jgi:hypothetical protein